MGHYLAQWRASKKPANWTPKFRKTDGVSQIRGSHAETLVKSILLAHGRKVEAMPYNSPFDLLVDGIWKCDVKCSAALDKIWPTWFFNFHRHNKLNENLDAYILRLENVPGHKKAVHLLFRAPTKVKTITFTLRSLIELAAPMVGDFKDFCAGHYQKEKAA